MKCFIRNRYVYKLCFNLNITIFSLLIDLLDTVYNAYNFN